MAISGPAASVGGVGEAVRVGAMLSLGEAGEAAPPGTKATPAAEAANATATATTAGPIPAQRVIGRSEVIVMT
jgi:hypothetical protein